MTHTITIKSEWERRMKLINDPIFRTMVRDGLVQMGITAEEWNDNAMYYWALIANEFCAIENAQ